MLSHKLLTTTSTPPSDVRPCTGCTCSRQAVRHEQEREDSCIGQSVRLYSCTSYSLATQTVQCRLKSTFKAVWLFKTTRHEQTQAVQPLPQSGSTAVPDTRAVHTCSPRKPSCCCSCASRATQCFKNSNSSSWRIQNLRHQAHTAGAYQCVFVITRPLRAHTHTLPTCNTLLSNNTLTLCAQAHMHTRTHHPMESTTYMLLSSVVSFLPLRVAPQFVAPLHIARCLQSHPKPSPLHQVVASRKGLCHTGCHLAL
jgi:hypothetical protein